MLLRLSELAKAWEVHPKTVAEWIKDLRLEGVRLPGGQYRVSEAAVRAFCVASEYPLPDQLVIPTIFVFSTRTKAKEYVRAFSPPARFFEDAYEAMGYSGREKPRLVLIDHSFCVAEEAVRALRELHPAMPIVVFDVTSRAKASGLLRFGATSALLRTERPLLRGEISNALRSNSR